MVEFLYDFPVQVFSKAEFRHLANMEEEKIQGTPVQKKLVCQAKQLLSEGYIPKNRQVYLSLPFIHNIQRGGKLFSNIQEDIENQNLKIKTWKWRQYKMYICDGINFLDLVIFPIF